MKHKLASIIVLTLLLLSGCTEPPEETGQSVPTPTPLVTTTAVTTHASVPSVTTTAPVTTEGNVPETTVPMTADKPITSVPVTDDSPVTDVPPTTDDPPAVPETVEIPAKLSAIAQRYPLASGLTGSYAGKTVTELLDSGTEAFENAVRRSVQAKGQVVLDKGIVTLMLGASRYDLALSYLSGTTGTELYSKISTDKGRSTEDRQVYIGGWLYNTGTTTENGKQIATDNFKVKMTPDQFSEYALSGADRALGDLSGLSKMIATADSCVAGMDEQGGCVILAKGIDEQLIRPILDPDDAIGNALSFESFDEMELAILIDADGRVSELYIHLPMRIVITQSGITLSVNGRVELTLSIDLPATVTVTAPSGAAQYKELTIEEAYANRSSLFNW